MSARNAMEIFTILEKSNCRKCGEKTCLAFAGAVFTGNKDISACPYVSKEDIVRFTVKKSSTDDAPGDDVIQGMKKDLEHLDFAAAAERCGGSVKSGRLTVKVLGKDFRLDAEGNFSSDIHVNPWVIGPYLTYILYGKGKEPTGKWISYREVEGGRERYGLFHERCEEDLRKVADSYPDLFEDMITIFKGREVDQQFASDISVVLLPLPKVPIMICYWKPEEELESKLNIYFDETVNENLGNDGIYGLCSGLTTMFEKIAMRHGF